ncbi:MAG: GAF domain-containing sensor histidine kinase [Brevundimonas sp.]|nr:GAF domain-containing sensor histidine kinase [Brevundimonas sp.]
MSVGPASETEVAALDTAAVQAVQGLSAVPTILEVCCRVTGMGFAAVARVTPDEWTACAVRDLIGFGLEPGGQLAVETTICHEIRRSREVVAFDDARADPAWSNHHTPRLYGLRSYISVPIIRGDGAFFGTLCAIDPNPRAVSGPENVAMFRLFADLIASQLDTDERLAASEAARLDEQTVSELRDQFIAVLGHDLRNPLAAIDAGLALLERAPAEDRIPGVVTQMKAASGRMNRLIGDVLDFARGRLGGGLPVGLRHAVDLGPMLEGVVDELRVANPARSIRLDVALDHPVACDPDRLAQLMSNLIANALTHGEGDVRIGGRSDGADLTLWVANSGAPIPEAARARLFEPFRRRGDSDGLGLGLYISAQIAKAHGGTLDLQSDETETRFVLRMPLDARLDAIEA